MKNVYSGLYMAVLLVAFVSNNISAQLQLDATTYFNGCAGTHSGFINLSVTGGSSPYSYNWSTGFNSPILSLVPAGTYSVTVEDAQGNIDSLTIDLVEPELMELDLLDIDFNCIDSGLVSIAISGGVGPYEIEWSNGVINSLSETMPSGDFSITITDQVGCATYLASEVPDSFYVDLFIINETCFMECDGSILAAVHGGAGPYTFDWEHGPDTSFIYPLHSDTFNVVVTEGSGCEALGSGIVNSPDPIEIEFIADTLLCGGPNSGDVSMQISGGVPPYTYIWSNGDSTTTIFDFPADSLLSVVVLDSVGCYGVDTFFHQHYDTLDIVMNVFPDDCGGTPDGTIFIDVFGGVGPYSYQWSNGSTAAFLYNIPAGVYAVTVTGQNGCSGSAVGEVEVVNSPLDALIVAEPPSTCLATDGIISVDAYGGVGPYTYLWEHGASGNILTDIPQGIYTVTIVDPLNCPIERMIDLNNYDAIDLEVSGAGSLCEEGDSLFLEGLVYDGAPPLEFLWSTGDTSAGIWISEGGIYQLTVEDSLGCYGTDFATVLDGRDLIVEIGTTNASCVGSFDGMAWVNVYFETGDYTVSWSTGDTGDILQGLDPGVYSVTVVDETNCPITMNVEIFGPDPILFELDQTDLLCHEDSTGSIVVNILTSGVEIMWSDGSTDTERYNLSSGDYLFTLIDSTGCAIDSLVQINQPDVLSIQADLVHLDCDHSFGQVSANIIGGTAPYSYQWTTGSTDSLIQNLDAGVYGVTVIDANDCVATSSYEIFDYDDILIQMYGGFVSCYGYSDGQASVMAYGGAGDYTYTWSTGDTTDQITDVAAGIYDITVCDALGCCAVDEVEVVEADTLIASVEVFAPNCAQSNDGYAIVTASGGAPYMDYYYNWSSSGSSANSGPLAPGQYAVTVYDTLLCAVILDVTIPEAEAYEYAYEVEEIICPGVQLGSITIWTDPDYPNAEIVWDNGHTGPILSGLTTGGSYGFSIYYDTDCVFADTIVLEDPDVMELDSFVITNGLCQEDLGSIEVFMTGGVVPYTYDWGNGVDSNYIDGLDAGMYTLLVTDANGCEWTDTFEIEIAGGLDINIDIIEPDCYGGATGSIALNTASGIPSYQYTWSTGESTSMISDLLAGVYAVTVCDVNDCCENYMIGLDNPAELLVDEVIYNNPCPSANNGFAELQINGGNIPYMIQWSNGTTGTQLIDVVAGVYAYTVTDEAQCSVEGELILTAVEEMEIEVEVEETCFGGQTGAISIDIVAGEGPFSIEWGNGSSSFNLYNLYPGIYTYTITDEQNCSVDGEVEITEAPLEVCEIVVLSPILDCEGATGSLEVILPQDSITVLWNTGETSPIISNLEAGTYEVTLTGFENCIAQCAVTLDAPNSMGDFVWYDVLANGIQDSLEYGIEGVEIQLFDSANNLMATTVSDIEGYYIFEDLPDGYYNIYVVDSFSNLGFTSLDTGLDYLDSDIDPATGWSALVELTGGVCYTDLDVGFTDNCIPIEDPGSIGYDQVICGFMNTPDEIVELIPATGGTQPYEYMWMYSYTYTPLNSGTWFPAPFSNSPNYQPFPLAHTTYFIRCVRADGCEGFQESNIIEIVVNPEVVAAIAGPSLVCYEDVTIYTAQDNGPNATYEWYIDGVLLDYPLNTTMIELSFDQVGNYELELIVTDGDCMSSNTQLIYASNSASLCGALPGGGSGGAGAGMLTGETDMFDFMLVPTIIADQQTELWLNKGSSKDIRSIDLISTTGQQIKVEVEWVNEKRGQMNVLQYKPGIYFISILTQEGSRYSNKLVITD